MKKLLVFVLLIQTTNLMSQHLSPEETIKQFFTDFGKRDSSLLSPYFTDEAHMISVTKNEEGVTSIHKGDVTGFLSAIGKDDGNKWREDVFNFTSQIDGDLAQVWCEYKFYYNDEFLHCGVDAFHLVNIDKTWKIIQLADTQRKKNCDLKVK